MQSSQQKNYHVCCMDPRAGWRGASSMFRTT